MCTLVCVWCFVWCVVFCALCCTFSVAQAISIVAQMKANHFALDVQAVLSAIQSWVCCLCLAGVDMQLKREERGEREEEAGLAVALVAAAAKSKGER